MEIGNILPNNLKQLRKQAKVTQKEIAQHLNVSVKTFRNYEKGLQAIPSDILIELHTFFAKHGVPTTTDFILGLANYDISTIPGFITAAGIYRLWESIKLYQSGLTNADLNINLNFVSDILTNQSSPEAKRDTARANRNLALSVASLNITEQIKQILEYMVNQCK